jgi:hypothetical protein
VTLRKRLRVLWSAWTQEWHEHACKSCPQTWWCVGANCQQLWLDDECPACLDAALSKVHVHDEAFTMRQRRRLFV